MTVRPVIPRFQLPFASPNLIESPLMKADIEKAEVQPLEAYAAKLDDGSHVAIHADESGGVFLRQGRHGKLRRITPRRALEELLDAMQDHDWAETGPGFPALTNAILREFPDPRLSLN